MSHKFQNVLAWHCPTSMTSARHLDRQPIHQVVLAAAAAIHSDLYTNLYTVNLSSGLTKQSQTRRYIHCHNSVTLKIHKKVIYFICLLNRVGFWVRIILHIPRGVACSGSGPAASFVPVLLVLFTAICHHHYGNCMHLEHWYVAKVYENRN